MPVNSDYKVSVIVPVYNVEQYLSDCLESICRQTLKGIEIIVVNDGSTDNSMRIIEDFAARDSRIQYHVQPNQGLSVARNQAMRYATGKYIYFMDSDDILDWTALQKCYLTCEEDNLDFVFFDAEPITSSEENENIPDYNR